MNHFKTRVLITGGNTGLGKNMIQWCTANDMFVECWDWTEDKDNWPHVIDYDWVIHLDACDKSEKSIDKILSRNYDFSCWLFNECNTNRTHFQYSSSYHVYNKDYSEFSECNPTTPYAWSKYLFDRWVFQQEHYINVHIFRLFEVYGKHIDYDFNIIPKNAKQIKKDFVWIGDVCKVFIDFIINIKGSGIWNIGSGLSHCVLDVAEETDKEIIYTDAIPKCKIVADLKSLKQTIGKWQWLNVYEYIEHQINNNI